ncbi:MAG: hypothetical protein HC800_19315 [Phormidesmis sp. RL_2_1]|nr:hypothetical protein [Phormidesmis sp. RL_2_1]
MSPLVRSVSDRISVAGQLDSSQFEQLVSQGFRSVINLRPYTESGATAADHQQVESLGLSYTHLPITYSELTPLVIDAAVQQVHGLPKPLLLYCKSSLRAILLSLFYEIAYQGSTVEAAKAKGRALGFDFDAHIILQHILDACTDKVSSR